MNEIIPLSIRLENEEDLITGAVAVKLFEQSVINKEKNKLSTTSKIYNINYSVYYFSTNLEHVLHDIQCVNDEEKMIYAQKFTDRFFKREIEFIAFINDPSFAVSGDYRSSWDFIKKDANSLNRYSNLHLFLADKVKSRK